MTDMNGKLETIGVNDFVELVKKFAGEEWNDSFEPQVKEFHTKHARKKIGMSIRQCKNSLTLPQVGGKKIVVIGWYLGCKEFGFKDKKLQRYDSKGVKAIMMDDGGALHEIAIWGTNDLVYGKKYELTCTETEQSTSLRQLKILEESKPDFSKLKQTHIEHWEDSQPVVAVLRLSSKIMKNNTGRVKHEYYFAEEMGEKKREGASFKIVAFDEAGDRGVMIVEPATYGIPNYVDVWDAEDIRNLKELKESEDVGGKTVNPRENELISLLAGMDIFAVGLARVSEDRKYINLEPYCIMPADEKTIKFVEKSSFATKFTEKPEAKTAVVDEGKIIKELMDVFSMTVVPIGLEQINNLRAQPLTEEQFKTAINKLIEEKKIAPNGDKWQKV